MHPCKASLLRPKGNCRLPTVGWVQRQICLSRKKRGPRWIWIRSPKCSVEKMNSDCLACSIAAKQIKMDTLYEDDTVIAVLDTKGANIGQMLLFPKRHVPIIEQLSAEEWKRMGIVGNALSVALFEALAPKGTNMFVANGVAAGHTVFH